MEYYVVNIDNEGKCMSSTIGYVRVSTLNQAEEGVSLEAQRRKIEAYCDLHDLDLTEITEDAGISGKSVSGRPGIQIIIDKVRARKVNNVVVFRLDRLARNLKEACEISELMEKKGVSLHSISEKIDTGSATGKLFYHILSAMNEWERGVISERTVTALSLKKSKGQRISRFAPYGYKFNGDNIVKVDMEQKVIQIVKEMTVRGHTIQFIINHLVQEGYSNRKGNNFGVSEIWKIRKSA